MLALLAAILLVRPDVAAAMAGGPKTPAKPALNVAVIGDFYSYGYANSTDPALQQSVPPTLQALNQIQTANPGVQVNVLFIPVRDATKNWLAQTVNAVRNANIVIVGVGADDARFPDWMRTVLFGAAGSAKVFPQLMAAFDSGSFLQTQAAFLADIAARAASGASIVTLGYPTVLPEQLPSGFTWWSPFRWTAISQQQANMSNQLVSALNTANAQATTMVAAKHHGLNFLFADLSGALQGKGPFGPAQGRRGAAPASTRGAQSNDLKQTIIGGDLLPYVDQAVNDELATKGLQGSKDVPPVTPTARWNLAVHMPVEVRVSSPRPKTNSGINTQPQGGWNNPARQPSSSPALPANPSEVGGPADNGRQASRDVMPSITIPVIDARRPSGDSGPGDTGRRSGFPRPANSRQPSGVPQPADSGQPSGVPQPAGTGQASGVPQPAATGQASGVPRPADSGRPVGVPQPARTGEASAAPQPATTGQGSAAPQPAGTGQGSAVPQPPAIGLPSTVPQPATTGQSARTTGSAGGPATAPMIPAPAAPLPPPITPHETPGAGGTGAGATAQAATQAPGTSPPVAAPAAAGTAVAAAANPATSTSPGGAASSQTVFDAGITPSSPGGA